MLPFSRFHASIVNSCFSLLMLLRQILLQQNIYIFLNFNLVFVLIKESIDLQANPWFGFFFDCGKKPTKHCMVYVLRGERGIAILIKHIV